MHRTRVARAHRDGPQSDWDVNRISAARRSGRKLSIALCVHVLWISFQLFVGRCARHDASPVRPAQGVGLGAVSNGDGRMSKFPMVGFSSFVGHDPSPFSGHERTTGSLSNHSVILEVIIRQQKFPRRIRDRLGSDKPLCIQTSAQHGQGFGLVSWKVLSRPSTPRPCSSKSARSFEKSTIPGQSSSHRVACQSRRGAFGQETEAVVGGGGCCGCSHRRSRSSEGLSFGGREKFGEDSGGEIQIAGASRFSSDGHFAIKAVQFVVGLEQLQMRVAQLKAQNEELMSSPKRQAVGSGAAPDSGSRLREDFVPVCDEDVVRWMRDRQLDMQQQLGMPTSWRDCAKLWRVQRRVCHRYQIRQWSRTLSGVIEEVHRQCDRTALCTGDISVGIARTPSGGGFQPGSQEEAPSC